MSKDYNEIVDLLLKARGFQLDLFLELIDVEISRLRADSDEGNFSEIKLNQGGIRVLKKIKSDLKPSQFIKGKDGAYL